MPTHGTSGGRCPERPIFEGSHRQGRSDLGPRSSELAKCAPSPSARLRIFAFGAGGQIVSISSHYGLTSLWVVMRQAFPRFRNFLFIPSLGFPHRFFDVG